MSNVEYLQILNYFQYQTHARFYLEVALDYLENTSFIVQYELRDQAAEKKIYFRRNYTVMLKVNKMIYNVLQNKCHKISDVPFLQTPPAPGAMFCVSDGP